MVRVVPSPVLCASVIIVEDPLEPLKILVKHVLLELYTFRFVNVHTQLLFIIESLSLGWLLCKKRDKLVHEAEVRLTILVNDLLLDLDL